MKMENNYGFKVELNGEVLAVAGLDDQHYVLSCMLTSLRRKIDKSEETYFNVGGLNCETGEDVDWVWRDLKLGDNLSITIVNSDFDKPTRVKPIESGEDAIKRKIEYYYKLKEELAGHLPE